MKVKSNIKNIFSVKDEKNEKISEDVKVFKGKIFF